MPYDVIVTATGNIVGQFASGKEASLFVAELKETGHQGPFRILFRPDNEIPSWHEREKSRFEDGTYAPLPEWLTSAEWYKKFAPVHHFAHPSTRDPVNKIAFTPYDSWGQEDKQCTLRVGAYFERYFNSEVVLQAGRPPIPTLVSMWRAHYVKLNINFQITFSAEEIVRIYTDAINVSPNGKEDSTSCMAGDNEENGGWPDGIHPAYVYGIDAPPGHPLHDKALALLYATNECGNYVGRVVIWPAKKVYSTIYAKNEYVYDHFVSYLTQAGYKRGSFEGAYIRRHAVKTVGKKREPTILPETQLTYVSPFDTPCPNAPIYQDLEKITGLNTFGLSTATLRPILDFAGQVISQHLKTKEENYLCPFIDRLNNNVYYLKFADDPNYFELTHTPVGLPDTTYSCGFVDVGPTYTAEDGSTVFDPHTMRFYRRADGSFALCNTLNDPTPLVLVFDYDPVYWPHSLPYYMKVTDISAIRGERVWVATTKPFQAFATQAAKTRFKNHFYVCPILSHYGITEPFFIVDHNMVYKERPRYRAAVSPGQILYSELPGQTLHRMFTEYLQKNVCLLEFRFLFPEELHPIFHDLFEWRSGNLSEHVLRERYPDIFKNVSLRPFAHIIDLPRQNTFSLLSAVLSSEIYSRIDTRLETVSTFELYLSPKQQNDIQT